MHLKLLKDYHYEYIWNLAWYNPSEFHDKMFIRMCQLVWFLIFRIPFLGIVTRYDWRYSHRAEHLFESQISMRFSARDKACQYLSQSTVSLGILLKYNRLLMTVFNFRHFCSVSSWYVFSHHPFYFDFHSGTHILFLTCFPVSISGT